MRNKIVVTLFLLLSLSQFKCVMAQRDGFRFANHYYTAWFDTCESMKQGGYFDFNSVSGDADCMRIWYHHTSRPLKIKGLATMVRRNSWASGSHVGPYLHKDTLPEFMYLFQKVAGDSMIYGTGREEGFVYHYGDLLLLDSLRFDTATPQHMQLPTSLDSSHYLNFDLYEVMFDKPIFVDSTFFIGGSRNGWYSEPDDNGHWYISHPVVNYGGLYPGWCDVCVFFFCYQDEASFRYILTPRHEQYIDNYYFSAHISHDVDRIYFPTFFAIIDQKYISITSADDEMGSTTNSGYFPLNDTAFLHAYPHHGYRFTHWDDGDTNNPKAIYLMRDTAFTAYFEELPLYWVRTETNSEDWGQALGTGTYYEGDMVELEASPNRYYRFECWSDGDTTNPRRITVTCDTSFTAIFSPSFVVGGIEEASPAQIAIAPNPTSGQVTVSSNQPIERLTLYSMQGKRLLRLRHCQQEVSLNLEDYPTGAYIVEIKTPYGILSKTIILSDK